VYAHFKDGIDGFDTEIALFGKCVATEDFVEGTAAFMEKGKPVSKGNDNMRYLALSCSLIGLAILILSFRPTTSEPVMVTGTSDTLSAMNYNSLRKR
jgi:hypothetical protein